MADPVWRLPLWQPYRSMPRSGSADLAHAAGQTPERPSMNFVFA